MLILVLAKIITHTWEGVHVLTVNDITQYIQRDVMLDDKHSDLDAIAMSNLRLVT